MYIGQQWFSKRTTIPIYEETEFDKQLYKQTLKPEQTKIAPRYLSLNLVIVPNLLFVQMYFLSATKQQLPLFYFATPPPNRHLLFPFYFNAAKQRRHCVAFSQISRKSFKSNLCKDQSTRFRPEPKEHITNNCH